MVANIVAPAGDHPPGYPGYKIWHYVAVVGFDDNGQQLYVADSANFSGINHYWISASKLLRLIATEWKGYAYGPAPEVEPDAKAVNAFRAAFMGAIKSDAADIRTQLSTAWPQLGNRTFDDALALVLEELNG